MTKNLEALAHRLNQPVLKKYRVRIEGLNVAITTDVEARSQSHARYVAVSSVIDPIMNRTYSPTERMRILRTHVVTVHRIIHGSDKDG